MERLRKIWENILREDGMNSSYEPLEGGSEGLDGEPIEHPSGQEFSWTDYFIFMLLGTAMLWAWYVKSG